MITYYELNETGEIVQATQYVRLAQKLGLTLQTEQKIIHGYDGKLYFEGLAPVEPEKTYEQKRLEAYPPMTEYLDAQVKLASDNPQIQTQGQEQLNAYLAACLAVKEQFPKEG